MTQDSTNNFPRPTNQWIEELVEVPVFTPEVNEKEGRVEFTQKNKKFKQKTYYADVKPTKLICNDHVYECIDKGKYIFRCTKCEWRQVAPPITYRFNEITGKLSRR